ncbi:uncharacterized protein N7511_007926 [Penicillium nucicola]|uniref:uncharacterized protein n=1 Tax=Penicillium nucicola TaxID=1850975 RepID=UPI0025452966|nr:uncharacterized protein N7511_007926 [Penicillium nucicola]KAJ5753773.1 hypothetical protein N7511_007926 [Penicillium nucicola]
MCEGNRVSVVVSRCWKLFNLSITVVLFIPTLIYVSFSFSTTFICDWGSLTICSALAISRLATRKPSNIALLTMAHDLPNTEAADIFALGSTLYDKLYGSKCKDYVIDKARL